MRMPYRINISKSYEMCLHILWVSARRRSRGLFSWSVRLVFDATEPATQTLRVGVENHKASVDLGLSVSGHQPVARTMTLKSYLWWFIRILLRTVFLCPRGMIWGLREHCLWTILLQWKTRCDDSWALCIPSSCDLAPSRPLLGVM